MVRASTALAAACAAAGALATAEGRAFAVLSYAQIENKIKAFAQDSPGLVKLTTAQDEFQVGTYGKCTNDEPCKNYIVHVTNHATIDSDPARPEVFFSGELHGDERVGPTTTVEFVQLLLDQYGTNPWITRLVDTRSIYIMPMANAHGYYARRREEGSVDVNRDFPIDDPSSCMESIAARALNELFRAHLFQLAITFHGGAEMVAFTWGTVSAQNRRKNRSPDDLAQIMLGSSMSAYGGEAGIGRRYPHGRMNDLIYAVRGGMEDWAYASSWDSGHLADPCHQADYPKERTTYGGDELRTINVLVETSDDKTPVAGALGTDEALMVPDGAGDGHIPRNVRLCLFLTDIVQPYVHVNSIDPAAATLAWEVGGAIYVDQTFVEYTFQDSEGGTRTTKSKPLKGRTRWSGAGLYSRKTASKNRVHLKGGELNLDEPTLDRAAHPYVDAFVSKIKLPSGGVLRRVRVAAKVDQAWSKARGAWPKLRPQSHFVNARTNEAWDVEHNGRLIKGAKLWFSDPTCWDALGKVEPCT